MPESPDDRGAGLEFRPRSPDSQPRLLPLPPDAPPSQRLQAGPQGISRDGSLRGMEHRGEGAGQQHSAHCEGNISWDIKTPVTESSAWIYSKIRAKSCPGTDNHPSPGLEHHKPPVAGPRAWQRQAGPSADVAGMVFLLGSVAQARLPLAEVEGPAAEHRRSLLLPEANLLFLQLLPEAKGWHSWSRPCYYSA